MEDSSTIVNRSNQVMSNHDGSPLLALAASNSNPDLLGSSSESGLVCVTRSVSLLTLSCEFVSKDEKVAFIFLVESFKVFFT